VRLLLNPEYKGTTIAGFATAFEFANARYKAGYGQRAFCPQRQNQIEN
jgi:hypothetical protein